MCSSTGIDIAGGPLPLLQQAAELLRQVGSLPLGGAVSDVELTQAVQCLEALGRMAEARKCAVVAEIEQRHAARGQSAASTEDLLTRVLHLTPGEAKARTKLAAGLSLLPDTEKAFADGRMGVAQAAVAVKKAAEVADRDDAAELLAAIDKTASTVGQTTNRTRLAREIDTAVAKTGVDVLAERERNAFRRRSLSWSVRDGMDVLTAHLDPIGAATVRGMLEALSDKTGDNDTRTFVQRQADAMVDIATLAHTARNMAQTTMPPSKVLLITTPDALHAVPGAEPATIDGHGPVSPELARQICCDASSGSAPPTLGGNLFSARVGGAAPRNQAARAEERALKGLRRATRRGPQGPRGRAARSTTSNGGNATKAAPTWTTSSWSAGAATPTSTNTAGKSPRMRPAATPPGHPRRQHHHPATRRTHHRTLTTP